MSTLTICLIICALTIASYVWNKISMEMTAMVSMVLFMVFGCYKATSALALFSNSSGIMIVAMFIVAAGFNRTQFVKNVATSVTKLANGSLRKVMFGYMVITIVLSQFIQSPLTVFSIMAPMLAASCMSMNISPSKVMFILGITAIATCGILPLGAGATVAAEMNGYLAASKYTTFTTLITDPMKGRWPVIVFCLVYGLTIGLKFAPDAPDAEISAMDSQKGSAALNQKPLPPFQEKAGYIIFFAVTLALILQSFLPFQTWQIAVFGAVLMVLSGVLSPDEAIKAMPMKIYFLYIGSLAMAGALDETGAGKVVGGLISAAAGTLHSPFLIYAMFFIVPFVLTQFMLNRSVMTIFVPIAIVACKSMGANPIGVIILIQAACLTAFMTPAATPAVPIFMAFGGYSFKSVIKQSLLPALCLMLISVGWVTLMFPLY